MPRLHERLVVERAGLGEDGDARLEAVDLQQHRADIGIAAPHDGGRNERAVAQANLRADPKSCREAHHHDGPFMPARRPARQTPRGRRATDSARREKGRRASAPSSPPGSSTGATRIGFTSVPRRAAASDSEPTASATSSGWPSAISPNRGRGPLGAEREEIRRAAEHAALGELLVERGIDQRAIAGGGRREARRRIGAERRSAAAPRRPPCSGARRRRSGRAAG